MNQFELNGGELNGPAGGPLQIDGSLGAPGITYVYDNAGGGFVGFGIETLSEDIEHEVTYLTATLEYNVRHYVTEIYTVIGTETLSYDVRHDVQGTDTISQDVTHLVWDPTLYFDFSARNSFRWSAIVTLEVKAGDRAGESGDISTNLTGELSVEAEESAARIATFTREPRPLGPCPTETDPEFLDLNKHIGRTVTIDYVLQDTDGTILSTTRIFTGYVDEVIYDPNTRLSQYTCTDGRQHLLENLDRASIDAMMPGSYYSDFVFDPEGNNLEYAEDRLSTVPYALDLDNQGTWQFTRWAAGASATYNFNSTNVIYESLSIELERFKDIVTEVEIDVGYNFRRLRERISAFSWSYPGSFCNYLDGGHTIPRKQMVVDAANGGGWRLISVTFGNLPISGAYTCSSGYRVWVNTGNGNGPLFCLDASGTLAKRFTSGVREGYTIRILAPDSATQYGTVTENMSLNVSAEFKEEGWTSGAEARIDTALIDRNPRNATTNQTVENDEFGYDYSLFGASEKYYDCVGDEITSGEGRREDFDNAIETIIAQGKTTLRGAHRQNNVSWQSLLMPDLQLYHTLEVDTCPVHARGKVRMFTHSMNLNTGEAVTDVTIAVSKTLGGAVSETPTAPPPIPDTVSGMGVAANIGSIGSRFGGQLAGSLFNYSYPSATSPEIDPNEPFDGYTGNRVPADVGSEIYPIQFQITSEQVDQADREEIEATETEDYNVDIPDELLDLQA